VSISYRNATEVCRLFKRNTVLEIQIYLARCTVKLQEGQVYEGHVSLSGGEGPLRRWLVVAPFGKTHIHSIDNPLSTHCWPAWAISEGMAAERARLVDFCPDHPMIRLQRAKEVWGIRDTALGLPRQALEQMVALMRQAMTDDKDMAVYAAGEIIELLKRTPLPRAQTKSIERHLDKVLGHTGINTALQT
jgi:hypothetical protein